MMRELRESQVEWSKRIAQWRRSGLTRGEFAQREGISPGQLAWWEGRLRTLGNENGTLEFVELVAPGAGVGVEVVLRGGVVVRVPVGFDERTVARLVRVLEGEAP